MTETSPTNARHAANHRRSDRPFLVALALLSGGYVVLLVAMIVAESTYTLPNRVAEVIGRPEVQASLWLTIVSGTVATLGAIVVGVPIGYLMSRHRFRGRGLVDAVLDIPQVLPPLVLGLCLLILFQTAPLRPLAPWVVYQLPAVFLAQFVVATSFAIPILRAAFEQTDPRTEEVALTLGCSRRQAFFRVTLPAVRAGVMTAAAVAWARCFGCFGPLYVFAGTTRNKTEVMATTIYLELNAGDIEAAVAVSLLMVVVSVGVLSLVRWLNSKPPVDRSGAA